jgi:hypothetical protein
VSVPGAGPSAQEAIGDKDEEKGSNREVKVRRCSHGRDRGSPSWEPADRERTQPRRKPPKLQDEVHSLFGTEDALNVLPHRRDIDAGRYLDVGLGRAAPAPVEDAHAAR